MSRRVRTLVVTAVLFVVAVAVTVLLPVPYVVLGPGITLNTLGQDQDGKPIITVEGGPVRSTSGHLNLTTVSVSASDVNAVQALVGWIRHDEIVVPRAAVYPPGRSVQQTDAQNAKDFSDSQSSAEAAAFCELGYPRGFGVLDVTSTAAKRALRPGDRLVSLDGRPIGSVAALTAALAAERPGASVTVTVVRGGATTSVPVTLSAPTDGRSGASIGIGVGTGCLAPYAVDFGLGNEIGGPSAGLMFALGIVDKIGTRDVTAGRFIAGTGTIAADGSVGPIGGIQLKMLAARRAGATVFLAPAGNCPDVRGNVPAGLDVVEVGSLHGALGSLQALTHGGTVPHC